MYLDQGLANHGPLAKSNPMPVSANKVLLALLLVYIVYATFTPQ